jgi:transcription antitermination factor NusG
MSSLCATTSIDSVAAVDCSLPVERWYAVHTRSRHEKEVAAQLAQKGIAHFAPTMREVHRWSDRRAVVDVPLFACYTFVRAALSGGTRLAVLNTPGVLRFVGFSQGPEPIPDAEIEAIQTVLATNAPFSPTAFVKVGERVRVRGGALDGIEGVLVGRNGNRQLLVSIELIQQSITVSLSGYDLERIQTAPSRSMSQVIPQAGKYTRS